MLLGGQTANICDEKEFALWLEMKDGFSWLGKRARTSQIWTIRYSSETCLRSTIHS